MAPREHKDHAANRRRRKQQNQSTKRPGTSVTPLKKRVRDLERLLSRGDQDKLPADIRVGYERELASCRSDLEDVKEEAQKSKMIGKYHKVRFFERKKAQRQLRQAQRRVQELGGAAAEDSNSDGVSNEANGVERLDVEKNDGEPTLLGEGELAAARAKEHEAQVNLNYALYYPLEKAYISLFAREKPTDKIMQDDGIHDGSPRSDMPPGGRQMWEVVEKAQREGKLQALRDGKLSHLYREKVEGKDREVL